MIHFLAKLLEIAAAAGAISGIAYNLLCIWCGLRFTRERKAASVRPTRPYPPVSILKPLKGTDPEMYENLRSHCLQDYPEYEIIFGVSDPHDPAVDVVEELKSDFPQRSIRLVVCDRNLGNNTKVSNLSQMADEARHQILVVNDGDIRVAPDYLLKVIAPLLDAKNGLVTCLYRGIAAGSLGSRLEAIDIATDFCPGVLAAKAIERRIRFGLGSTLAFRRAELDAIGGFHSFVDYLADDYELGKRIAENGLKVVLSEEVVETFLPDYDLSGYLKHQLRWSRTVRASRFWGSVGLIFTFALPSAILTLFFSKGALWAWGLLVLACCARIGVAWMVGRKVLEDQVILRHTWLIPLRDIIAPLVWITSFAGHTVVWRGETFMLKEGRLMRTAK